LSLRRLVLFIHVSAVIVALDGAVLDRALAASAGDAALQDARPLPHNAYKAAIARWCDASYFARVRWRMSDMTDATRNFCLYLRTKNGYFRSRPPDDRPGQLDRLLQVSAHPESGRS
jgi:hypothetical protein